MSRSKRTDFLSSPRQDLLNVLNVVLECCNLQGEYVAVMPCLLEGDSSCLTPVLIDHSPVESHHVKGRT